MSLCVNKFLIDFHKISVLLSIDQFTLYFLKKKKKEKLKNKNNFLD